MAREMKKKVEWDWMDWFLMAVELNFSYMKCAESEQKSLREIESDDLKTETQYVKDFSE